MKHLRWILLAAMGVGSALLVWSVAREPYPQAPWIAVESPRYAVIGSPLTLRVTLPPPVEPRWIIARLNWSDTRKLWGGFLYQTPPEPVPTNGRPILLEFPVPPRTNMGQVHALIYLSSSRYRSNQMQYVQTVPLRAKDAGTIPDGRWRHLHAYEPVPDPEIRPRESSWARWLTATLWIIAGGLSGFARRPAGAISFSWRPGLFLGLCLACAVCELANADLAAAAELRSYAHDHQLYPQRRDFQKIAMVAGVVSVLGILTWLFWKGNGASRVAAGLAVALFTLFSLASVFSLHETDRVLALQGGPLPLVQWMKLLAAAGAFCAFVPRRSASPHD